MLAAWVFKPRLTKHSSVIVTSHFVKELVSLGESGIPILWWQRKLFYYSPFCTRLEDLCCVCVCVSVLGSSSINSPTSGGSGGIDFIGISKPEVFPLGRRRARTTGYKLFVFFFIFILYLPIVCVYCLFPCAFFQVGVSGSSSSCRPH